MSFWEWKKRGLVTWWIGRHHLNQVIWVNITSNERFWHYVVPHVMHQEGHNFCGILAKNISPQSNYKRYPDTPNWVYKITNSALSEVLNLWKTKKSWATVTD